jgi:hypothetical protein
MATNSLTADNSRRNISFLKTRIAEKLHTIQGLLFVACDMFDFLPDIEAVDEDMPLMRQWRDLAEKLLED